MRSAQNLLCEGCDFIGFFDFFKRKSESTALEPSAHADSTKSELPDSDIMLLEYCTYGSYPNPKHGYPQLWEHKFHITDVDHALQSLANRGYIEFCPAHDMLPKFTIAQLKDIAKKNGVVVKGKKTEILSAMSKIPAADLEQTITDRKYRLTESGICALEANKHIVFAYKNPWTGISVEELKSIAAQENTVPGRDTIWAEFNRRCYYLPLAGAWREYRQVRYSMFMFLKQEQKHLSLTSHVYLSEVLYLDLNSSVPVVAPGLVSDMQHVAAACNSSADELFSYVSGFLSGFSAPRTNFSDVDVAGIYTALALRLYDEACVALSHCPKSSSSDECFTLQTSQMRVRSLETGEWELVPEMPQADYLIHQVLYIQKFIAPA